MKGKVGSLQNPGVCLQAFPSFPFPPLFSRGNSLPLNATEMVATQAIINWYQVTQFSISKNLDQCFLVRETIQEKTDLTASEWNKTVIMDSAY